MGLYSYKAVRPDGQTEEGELEAADELAVVASLQSKGLIPLETRAAGGIAGYLKSRSRRTLGLKEISLITREMATLLESGLPLDRSLQVLIELNEEEEKLATLLSDVQERVRGGANFSDALEAQSGVFSRLYVNMVRAGEASGNLEAALGRLAEYLERSEELKETIKSALVYPSILLVVAGMSLVLLLVFVVPQFATLFDDMGAALPTPTRIVIALGDFFRDYWLAMLFTVAFGALGAEKLLQRPRVRARWDRWVTTLPLFGDLVWKLETARFCHTLATLLENGMPLLGALGLAREVVANRKIAGKLETITDDLKRGRGLADPLNEHQVFPKLALQMIRVGEESGNLDPMLTKVALVYDRETRDSVQRMLTLLEPAVIIVMGVMVAGIIVSILVAILGANELLF
jgi:general secretion pathway protein F